MDNFFVCLNYYESRALLDYLKDNLLIKDFKKEDANYLLTAFLKLQIKYDQRTKEIACMD